MGGTGGDFLKNICLEQIGSTEQSQAELYESGQVIFKDRYFKSFCTYHCNNNSKEVLTELDTTRINPIENSHYYFDWFVDLTDKIYYIDYPDRCVTELIKIYNQKQRNGDLATFISDHRATLPIWAQNKLTADNALEIFSILWLKQQNSWRKNPNLIRIDIADFFVQSRCQQIVETLINRPISNVDQFNSTYSGWIKYNTTLKNLIG